MTVYVDFARNPFGRMIMCHMFSPKLDELHAMADAIGVARRWFQDPSTMPRVSWHHYDICRAKRVLAVAAGAQEVDRYQFAAMAGHIKRTLNHGPGWPLVTVPVREAERVATWLDAELTA